MKNRIKEIRKKLDLTQQEFADRLGIKRGGIANYEIGRNEPADLVISLICREFNVNETWLRTGMGDMFLPTDRNADIAKLTKRLLNEESDSFKNRFVSMLANLTVEEWELLERKAKELCGMDNEMENKFTASTKKERKAMYNPATQIPDTPEELEALYPPIDIKDASKFDAG